MIGEVRGTVVDRTLPVHPVAGQLVRLEIVEPAATSTRDTTTDALGRFAFRGLPVGGTRVFMVRVTYSGVPYTARAVLTAGAAVHDMPVSVFAATTDRAAVRGTLAFAVFEVLHDAVRVSVIERLANTTDRAVRVTDANPLTFPLPVLSPRSRAAVPVAFVDGWRDPHIREGVITDAIPVLPGVIQVAYAFGLAPRISTATVRWEFPYGASDVELLTDTSLRLSGAAVHGRGIVTER